MLVVFDIDGTLQDTTRWWPALCNEARRDFAALHGVEVSPLDARCCNEVVGRGAEVWSDLLPTELSHRASDFAGFVIEREVQLLRSGSDLLFDGTMALLGDLHTRGHDVMLASNCGAAYLEGFLSGQLAGFADRLCAAACLEGLWRPAVDPGANFVAMRFASKVESVAALLEGRGPERAVLVGDRASDAEAARAHGLAFVLRTSWHGRGELGEDAAFAESHEGIEVLAQLAARDRCAGADDAESSSAAIL